MRDQALYTEHAYLLFVLYVIQGKVSKVFEGSLVLFIKLYFLQINRRVGI